MPSRTGKMIKTSVLLLSHSADTIVSSHEDMCEGKERLGMKKTDDQTQGWEEDNKSK